MDNYGSRIVADLVREREIREIRHDTGAIYGTVTLRGDKTVSCTKSIWGNWHFSCPDCKKVNIVRDRKAVEDCKFCAPAIGPTEHTEYVDSEHDDGHTFFTCPTCRKEHSYDGDFEGPTSCSICEQSLFVRR